MHSGGVMNNPVNAIAGFKAWKWYFWFNAVLGIGTLLLDDAMGGLIMLFGAVGLYGYIWCIPIANYAIWQLYLLGIALLLGYKLLKLADPAVRYFLLQNELLAAALLVLFVTLNGPLYYALIRYSSKNHRAWKKQDA
jgi:hypothetical protein